MIITQEEAGQLACPFAQAFNGTATYVDSPEDTPHCLGPRCMSWEWADPEYMYPNSYLCKQLGIPFTEEIKPPIMDYADPKGFAERTDAFEKEYPNFNWFKVNDERMLAAGWEFNPAIDEKFHFTGGTQTVHRWRRLHPARTGQCGRTVIISVDRD